MSKKPAIFSKSNNKSNSLSFSSIIQLALLVFGLVIAVFLTDQTQKYIGRASSSPAPKNIKITNVSPTSFVVSWQTDSPTTGIVLLSSSSTSDQVIFDDRTGTYTGDSLFTTHYTTIKNLAPDQTYSFVIQSGKEKYQNQGKPFSVTTPSLLTITPPSPIVVYGNIVDQKGNSQVNSLVYLEAEAFSPLSIISDQNGNFAINLSNCRNKALIDYCQLNTQQLNLSIYTDKSQVINKTFSFLGADQNLGTLTVNNDLTTNSGTATVKLTTQKTGFFERVILFFKQLLNLK